MATYEMSDAMRRHLERTAAEPEKAMELGPALRRELDGLSREDLAEMAKSVKYVKGQPIHLTEEQNEAFRAQNRHMPTFGKGVPRAPAGKYAQGSGPPEGASMRSAWERFGGSFEEFKAAVFKAVPAELRVGKQEWLVQATAYSEDGKVAIMNGGSFYDDEAAMAHAQRLQDVYPWFDFHVVSQWAWVAYPPDDETARGIQRTYKDKNLEAVMREHFRSSVAGKERQQAEQREVEERRGPRAEAGEPEFPPTTFLADQIDDGAGDDEVVARE